MALNKRYAKNIGTIGEDGQRRLLASHVVIAGAGGLGGTVFEILLRSGVGTITIIDFDAFDVTNLNRQLLSSEENLGENKTAAAAKRAAAINPDVEVIPIAERISDANATALLADAHLVCDCLGNIRDRFILERAARALRIPMIHAAIAGERGQIMTVVPGSAGIETMYGKEDDAPHAGEELEKGTPPSSVMTVAALQAHEAIKTLTGKPRLQSALLLVELSDYKIKTLRL